MEWIGIIGMVVGFGLGEVSRWIHGLLRTRKLKALIEDELEAIKYQIRDKRDIIKQILNALANSQILGGSSVKFLDAGYRTYFFEINEHLTLLQRNCIHVIYERLNNIDGVLFAFEDEFRSASKDPVVSDAYEKAIANLTDCKDSLNVIRKLIDSYLDGSPIDVFYIEQPLDENKQFS